jgi:hypothetical protein
VVTVWTGLNQTGTYKSFGPGNHDFNATAELRALKGKVKSMRVPAGCQAVIWNEVFRGGRMATINGPAEIMDLDRITPQMRDRVESLRVTCG